MIETDYGEWISDVELHSHAQKMGELFAQIQAKTPKDMELLQELGKLIQDLYIPR